MGTNISVENKRNIINNKSGNNNTIVPRDNRWDTINDVDGIKYLKAHAIPELFWELKGRLLEERPLQPYKYLRDILIHKVIEQKDLRDRMKKQQQQKALSTKNSLKRYNTIDSVNNIDDINDMDELLQSRIRQRPRSLSDSNIKLSSHNVRLNIPSMSDQKTYTIDDILKTNHVDGNTKNTTENNENSSNNNNDNNNNDNTSDNNSVSDIINNNEQKSMENEHFKKLESFTKSLIQQAFKTKSSLKRKFRTIKSNMNPHTQPNLVHAKTFNFKLSEPKPLERTRSAGDLKKLSDTHQSISHQERACFGFDIGGSLVKICVYEPKEPKINPNKAKLDYLLSSNKYGTTGIRDESLSFNWNNGKFHFITFATTKMKDAVDLFKDKKLISPGEPFFATGGGAHKYGEHIIKKLKVNLKKGDELKCLLYGLNFLLAHIKDELYYLSDPTSKDYKIQEKIYWNISLSGNVFPYLFVNIGSGVSILKVLNPKHYERVSGTMIGGGTYYGLLKTINDFKENNSNNINNTDNILTFNKAFEYALKGDSKKVNMLVSDIYGGDYKLGNLKGDIVASSFGKMINKNNFNKVNICDISRALLDMIAMNIAHLAYLNAIKYKINRIIFAGNFLRENNISMSMITFAIHYWSKGVMKALFLKHEGYFGSLGVFLTPNKDFDKE